MEIKRVGDAGIHTVEGQVSGNRAAQLAKERDKQRQEYEELRKTIKEQNTKGTGKIEDRFVSANAEKVTGLTSVESYLQAAEQVKNTTQEILKSKEEQIKERKEMEEKKKKERESKRKKKTAALSFSMDDDDEAEEEDTFVLKKDRNLKRKEEDKGDNKIKEHPLLKKKGKNPDVATDFLPDQERDRLVEEEKQRLRLEWQQKQEDTKKEKLEVTYSYWDGSGHRKELTVTKGTTIGKFLQDVKHQLTETSSQFRTLKGVSADTLGK